MNTINGPHKQCPFTGLPVITRPEWTDIQLTRHYSVTFKFIGDRILLVLPKGNAGEWGVKRLFEKRGQVVDEVIGPTDNYLEIRDFGDVRVQGSPRNARVQMVEGLREDQSRLLGFIGYNIPKTLQLVMQVAKKLYNPPFYFGATGTYESAIRVALSIVQKNDAGVKKLIYATVTKDDWQLRFPNGAASNYEIINDNILYSQSTGVMVTEHVPHIFEKIKKIAEYIVSHKTSYYIILDIRYRERASKAARKAYIKKIKQLFETYPFDACMFCGANRFFQSAFYLTKPFLPFHAYSVSSLTEALTLIQTQEQQSFNTSKQHLADASGQENMQRYAEELTHYLGSINWEVEGIHHTRHRDPDHPFGVFYDAMDLIKNDLDDLLHKRKQAETDLKRSEEKYRTIIEEIADGYYEVNLRGDMTFCNDALSRIFGYPENELIGLNNRAYMSQETATKVYSVFNRVYTTEEPERHLVYDIVRKEGKTVYIDVSISLIRGNDGEKAGFRGIIRDVTKQKETDEALMTAKKAAEDASQAKSDFLANISHELRTPMNGIMGMTGFLLETELNNEQREYAEAAYDGANRMMSVVNDLLDFAKLENSRLRLCTDRFNIQSVLKDVKAVASKVADQKGIAVRCQCDPAIPSYLVGDPERIKQILLNLVDNAIKFTPSGSVDLDCTCRADSGNSVMLCVTVRDTGIGIPAGHLDRLFESFTQFDSSLTRPYDGAGLGLPITRQLVEMMGGTIQVESEEHEGSTFTCTLMLNKAVDA